MIVRLDPCGLVCVVMIYGCVVYADYVVTIWMVMPVFGDSLWGAFHIAVFNTLIFMTLFSHGRTMLTDPGVVPILKNG
ncbi:hypothetical protein Q1695_009369 [Nippostrongylus brasiliensis]|nr:hypothetical protein Q1695_009369 [Nippostrongylus brasiliensis]